MIFEGWIRKDVQASGCGLF